MMASCKCGKLSGTAELLYDKATSVAMTVWKLSGSFTMFYPSGKPATVPVSYKMTRDFIFDAAGAVIGYRCRLGGTQTRVSADKLETGVFCNRLFPTARGLRAHQRVAHGLFKQLSFKEIEALEERNEL